MPDSATLIRSLPARDRIAILAGLLGVSALAWAYLIKMAIDMQAMPPMAAGEMLQIRPWASTDFVFMFLMWAIMMVGMMVPTAIPMTLIHAEIGRKAAAQGTPIASTAMFVVGYVAMWTAFSAAATLAQWALDQAALLSPMMVTNSPQLGAGLLIGAGIYQITPMKDSCLRHCRSPAHFISEHWRPGVAGALRMGAEHGAFCLGCCWLLMALLFFGGVMNLLWIAAITLFVLLEKVLPLGDQGGRVAGVGMIVLGVVLLVRWLI